ncbi:kinase-like domain-containing protein [Rhizophagus irregularis DAOM 181602=DAOM 197198]|nr:kinase-like domain-containing protein [Rhizophagus irregularis DAOM 181602=DAOM 197198]
MTEIENENEIKTVLLQNIFLIFFHVLAGSVLPQEALFKDDIFKVETSKTLNSYLIDFHKFIISFITLKEIVNELKFQRDVYFHNNIIRFYGITKLESSTENIFNPTKGYLLVVEYTDSGTLREYLKNNFHRFTWNDKYNLAYQLACSVLCLHEEGIVHRDLHSSNVLIHQGSIKLADFGLSKRINDASKSQSKLLEEYDFSLMYKISQGRREITVPNTPNDYSNLYTECWNNEPSKRPSIHEVVNRLRTSNRITIYQQNDISDKTSPMPNENKTPIRELSNIDTTSEIDRMSTNEQNKQLVENLENSLGENENLREKLQILQKGNTELIELNKTLRSQLDETTAQLECARPSVYQGNKDIDAVMENDKKVRSLLESRMVDLMAKKNKFMCF